MKDKHITKFLLILLTTLCSSCCIYQDIEYSIHNWQMSDEEVEFYKPATMPVVRFEDRERVITPCKYYDSSGHYALSYLYEGDIDKAELQILLKMFNQDSIINVYSNRRDERADAWLRFAKYY